MADTKDQKECTCIEEGVQVLEEKPLNKDVEVKTETKEEFPKTWIPNIDEINQRTKEMKEMISEAKERINKMTQVDELNAQIKALQDAENKRYQVARISTENNKFTGKDLEFIAKEGVQNLRKNGFYSFSVDMPHSTVLDMYDRKKIEEAISFSGTQSQTTAAMNDVFVLPGGKYAKSIRDLVRFKEIADGDKTINFYKGDVPDSGTITEGSDTSAATHALTTVTLAADTVTGVAQVVKQADIENSPFEVFSYLAQTARIEALHKESYLVFNTAAAAATPHLWIKGSDGSTITTDDTASVKMEPVALATALQDLETSQYDIGFGDAFCALHAKQLRELRTTSNLTTYIQQGDATITKTGRLTHLYGIELIQMPNIVKYTAQTNQAYRAVVGIKGHTFALGSHREVMVDLLKIPKQSAYDWTWSQRKNATTFDANSFIQISTTV